jgi:hypothetical protein
MSANTNLVTSPINITSGTNVTITGQLFADSATFTNGIVIGAGGTNLSVTGNVLANGGVFTNTLTLNGTTVLVSGQGGDIKNTGTPVNGNLATYVGTTGTNVSPSTNISIFESLWGTTIGSPVVYTTTIGRTNFGDNTPVQILGPVTIFDNATPLTPGYLVHGQLITVAPSSTSVTFATSNSRYDNTGASAKVVLTLTAALPGKTYSFTVTDTDGIDIVSVGDDVFQVGSTVTSAAATITSTVIGSTITFTAHNSTTWVAESLTGDWTYSGSKLSILPTSGVTAGVYGNSSYIPQITVDNKGIVTSVTTNIVSTMDIASSLGTDDTYTGIIRTGRNNSGGVTQWDAVYLNSSSQWVLADANGSGTYPCRGIATATVATGNATTVITRGTIRNDAWAWTVGGTIYLSTTAGGLTQTAPSTTGDKVQVIGYALDADTMAVEISPDYGTAP